jgi:hypothetical protein
VEIIMAKYLSNAFSLQMLENQRSTIEVFPAGIKSLIELKGYESSVGHEEFANQLGVAFNRTNLKLKEGDELLVAQYIGGRMPENKEVKISLEDVAFFRVRINYPQLIVSGERAEYL